MRKTCLIMLAAAIMAVVLAGPIRGTTTPRPDLQVTELSATQIASTTIPLRLRVDLRIKNRGNAPTPSVTCVTRLYYRLHSNDPWQTLYEFTSGALPSGGTRQFSHDFDFPTGGTYTFKAEVDAGKSIAESSESNNTKTYSHTFAGGTPDLVVENLVATTVQVMTNGNWKVKAEWDVHNIGDGKAPGSFATVLKVFKNNSSSAADLQSYSRSNLAAGNSLHFSNITTFSNVHALRFKVITDSNNAVHEKREDNNTAQSATLNK